MKTRSRVTVKGRVQNVGFRAFIQNKSNEFSVKGWVRNTENDDVEAVFEGDTQNVQRMLKACEEGPRAAQVEKVDAVEQAYKNEFEDFNIL
ncbi:MAG: acylphosphatase [Balneolales bacterium]